MAATGYKQSVRWRCEVPDYQYGSYLSTMDQSLGLVQSITPGEKNNLFKIKTLGGTRDYYTIIPGKFEVTGAMEYYLQGCAFLRQAIGEDTASTDTIDSGAKLLYPSATAGMCKHIMGSANSPGINDFPSFQLEFTDYEDSSVTSDETKKLNLKRTYVGCRVNRLTLSANIDEPVKVAVDWLAKRVIVGTSDETYSTEIAQDPFVFYQGAIYMTTGEATVGDASGDLASDQLVLVNSFELTVNNNCEAVWYICGTTTSYDSIRSAKAIYPKGRDYSLRLGMHYQDREMYERFLGALGATADQPTFTKPQVVLDFVRGGEIGSVSSPVSSPDYIRMVAGSVVFDDMAINGGPEDIVGNDTNVFVKGIKFFVVDNDPSYKS